MAKAKIQTWGFKTNHSVNSALFSIVLPLAHLKLCQTVSIPTHTGQSVDTVALEVELAPIEGQKVWIAACSASLKADWVTVLDSVHNVAFLSGSTPSLLTFGLLCRSVTRTLLLTLWVCPESLTWTVVPAVVGTATARLPDNTPDEMNTVSKLISHSSLCTVAVFCLEYISWPQTLHYTAEYRKHLPGQNNPFAV